MRKKVLIVGAGASGRGHMGQLAFESGHELVFLDKDRDLVDRLRSAGRYAVHLVGPEPRDFIVDRFEVFHLDEGDEVFEAFAQCPLIFTTVCPNNLRDVADYFRPLFLRWLERPGKDFKNVLCCENMDGASKAFRSLLLHGLTGGFARTLDVRVGFADTMIARVVTRPKDPLRLLGEEYSEWTADRTALRGDAAPAIRTLELVDDQERYLQRKLYIHNTGHATFGYLGFLRGYTYIHEAARDPQIVEVSEMAIEESGWAVQKEHKFPGEEIRRYRKVLIEKCPSEALPDEIRRVVREPMRKLGPAERFFGPTRLLLKHGREPRHLLYGACAAMLADIEGDPESERLRRLVRESGVRGALSVLDVTLPEEVVGRLESYLEVVRDTFARRP